MVRLRSKQKMSGRWRSGSNQISWYESKIPKRKVATSKRKDKSAEDEHVDEGQKGGSDLTATSGGSRNSQCKDEPGIERGSNTYDATDQE